MSATSPNRRPLTYEDYALLPADGRRWELMGGDFHVSPAPTSWHQAVVTELTALLLTQLRSDGSGRVLVSPLDVVLDETNTLQPDLVVISTARRHLVSRRGVEGAPDLVVEVISPDYASKDQVLKRHLYERFGVAEYWLVDPESRSVVTLSLQNGRFVEVLQLRATGVATSTVFPAVRVALEDLFREL